MAERGGALHHTRIHRALSRPNLVLGADRELVLFTALIAAILIFVILTPFSALIGVSLWIILLTILRRMAKVDPLMRAVYLRHIKYRRHYLPTSSPWRQY